MKAVRISRFLSNVDDVTVSDISKPKPKEGEVVVQVKAAGVNFVDTLYARGQHQNNRRHVQPPFTLGLEFAGRVEAAAPGSGFRRGDRVFGSALGAYAEQICVAPMVLSRMPAAWSWTDAAGLAATLPVAYAGLVDRARLQADDSVLVLGAAGGLGCMAVQVASRVVGCRRVIAVASSPAKCAVARACGAAVCIDLSTCGCGSGSGSGKTWWQRVLDATDGIGVDVVFDPVGLVSESLKCLAHGGRLLIVGFAGRDNATIESVAMNRVLLKQATLIGYRYGESVRRNPQENQRLWVKLNKIIADNQIQPVLYDQPFIGLESVSAALRAIADRKVFGKAVVTVDSIDEKAKI